MNEPHHCALNGRAIALHSLVVALALVGLLTAIWYVRGRLAAEQTLTQIALPGGLLAIALAYGCFLAVRYSKSRSLTAILFFALAVYWVVGNEFASDFLFQKLERDFYSIHPLQSDPYDVLVVLGGGSTVLDDGRVQTAFGSDRIVLAARLYHLGKTSKIVIGGGTKVPRAPQEISGSDAAVTLLVQLGVKPDDVEPMYAANTKAELEQVKTLFGNDLDLRVGLLTSAWHIRRALRLADDQGLHVVPVPADFQSLEKKDSPVDWVPTGSGFWEFQIAAKKFLAESVGR